MSSKQFQNNLKAGQVGEGYISRWLRQVRGCSVLPVYEKELGTGKGPQFFCPDTSLVAPDMLILGKENSICWIEAKTKARFTWHGKSSQWQTGIDYRHYLEYQQVADRTPWPLWIMFFHTRADTWGRDVERWGAPPVCPTGLYGNQIEALIDNESHISAKHGKSGMVYWNIGNLKKVAGLQEVLTAITEPEQGCDTGDTLRVLRQQVAA